MESLTFFCRYFVLSFWLCAASLVLTGTLNSGVKQLEKLIRKRLEEKRKDKAMRKAEKSEERARSQ